METGAGTLAVNKSEGASPALVAAFLAEVFLTVTFLAGAGGAGVASGITKFDEAAGGAKAAFFGTAFRTAFFAGAGSSASAGISITFRAAGFLAVFLAGTADSAEAGGVVFFFMPDKAGASFRLRKAGRVRVCVGKSGIDLIHQFVRDFKIGEDVLGVVEFIEEIVKMEDRAGRFHIGEGDGSGG